MDRTDGGGWSYNGLCNKCGKPYVYVGDVPPNGFMTGSEPYCTCNENKHIFKTYSDKGNIFISNEKGWICPKCNKVFSPSIIECIYCNGISVTSTWITTTDTVKLNENDDTQISYTSDDQTDDEESE